MSDRPMTTREVAGCSVGEAGGRRLRRLLGGCRRRGQGHARRQQKGPDMRASAFCRCAVLTGHALFPYELWIGFWVSATGLG